jgi:hypothetical protein
MHGQADFEPGYGSSYLEARDIQPPEFFRQLPPEHLGIRGNELADELAKEGHKTAFDPESGPTVLPSRESEPESDSDSPLA